MNASKVFHFTFILVSTLYLLDRIIDVASWINYTKPLLMITLMVYFISELSNVEGAAKWILLALFFSLLGDSFLMSATSLHFLLGLGSFLIAHLLYIFWYFSMISLPAKWSLLRHGWPLSAALLIFLGVMFTYILPGVDELALPVVVYGIVITSMGIMSILAHQTINRPCTRIMLAGSLLFIISDTILALDKFTWQEGSVAMAPFLVMLTYILAQYLIVRGAINYLNQ